MVGTATLSGDTFSNNWAAGGVGSFHGSQYPDDGGSACGGAIFGVASMAVSNSTFDKNIAVGGGAGGWEKARPGLLAKLVSADRPRAVPFTAQGDLTMANSTITGNSAVGADGGSFNPNDDPPSVAGGYATGGTIYCPAMLVVTDSTLVENSVTGGTGASGTAGPATGGGMYAYQALLNNTILAGNQSDGAFDDTDSTIDPTSGYNLIGIGGGLTNGVNGNLVGVNDPKLLPLGNYGGSTQTMLPMLDSPAINAGSNALIPAGVTTDQRG